MIEKGIVGVEFIAMNTDSQDLRKNLASVKFQLGPKLTGGRGAGGSPQKGEAAAKEDVDSIKALVENADMVFITAGMGGGTGTGAAPVIARVAKEMGILVVGVVTLPFKNEGAGKARLAEEGIKKMRESVDTLVVIPNQQILKIVDAKTSVVDAYRIADEVLRQGVQGITDLIIKTGVINTDFSDIESTMRDQGDALMGIGRASGEDRAQKAVKAAIDNPLLEETCVDGATRLLVNISGSEDISIVEVDEIMNIIKVKADPDVNIIHGLIIDPALGDHIQVTVIATGFREMVGSVSGKSETPKKAEAARDDIISVERFNEMRGQGKSSRPGPGDGHFGGQRSRGVPIEEDLDVPAIYRRQSQELENRTLKFGNGGKEA